MMTTLRQNLFAAMIIFILAGCGAKRALEPAPAAGFIERKTDGVITDRTPFDYFWRDGTHPIVQRIRENGRFDIYVAPIRLDYLRSDTDSRKDALGRGEEVAEYFHRRLVEAINKENEKAQRARVVDTPIAGSLTLEIALTALDTGNPVAYAAGFAVPVPGVATAVDTLGIASLAMEGKVFDSDTRRPLIEFADRKTPRFRPVDLNRFTKTKPLLDVTTDWSTEIARGTATDIEKNKIEGTAKFSLLLW